MPAQLMLPGMERLYAPDESVSERLIDTIHTLLRRYACGKGECWPSRQTLASKAGACLRQVSRAIKALVRRGCVATRRRGRKGVRTTLYVLIGHDAGRDRPPPDRHRKVTSEVRSGAARTTCFETGVKKPMVHGARAAAPGNKAKSLRPGSLASLQPRDLQDPHRMHEELASVLVAYDTPGAAEKLHDPHTLLRWFGLARRALRVGRNPGALFRSLLAGRRWAWISQDDEDGAREDVRRVLHGDDPRRSAPPRNAAAECRGEYDE